MELLTSPLLFLDCQTTGMRPSVGHLLEMAWGWGKASDSQMISLHSNLVQLPEGQSVPSAVSEITGIEDSHLEKASSLEDLHQHFMRTYAQENETSKAVIHYAQFEKPFLEDFFFRFQGDRKLPFDVICSQILAKKVLPSLPSRNIRGLSGYFGSRLGELRRASSHVQATFLIWQGLVQELNRLQVHTFEDLDLWLRKPTEKVKIKYEYRIEKEKRLQLPNKPGIYRMKAKSGEVLYVGKATSLKDRVNSYFRGKKGRDPKKLEMLTQVWDFDFVETSTALEAALLENDEIKRLDPPYNISLKIRERSLLFYSHHFVSSSPQQNEVHYLGPFRPGGPLDQLKMLSVSLQQNVFYPLFYQPISADLMKEGFDLFCQEQKVDPSLFVEVRSSLALGSWLLRKQIQSEKQELNQALNSDSSLPSALGMETSVDSEIDSGAETETETDVEPQLTALDVSDKYKRLMIRAARELRRAKIMTRLLNCHIEWESEVGWKTLDLQEGKIQLQELQTIQGLPWQNLTIADYDRMSVLLSEISKHSHRVVVS